MGESPLLSSTGRVKSHISFVFALTLLSILPILEMVTLYRNVLPVPTFCQKMLRKMLKVRVMPWLDNTATLHLLCIFQSSSVYKFIEFSQYCEKDKTTFLLVLFYFPLSCKSRLREVKTCPKSGARSSTQEIVFLPPVDCSTIAISSGSYRKLWWYMAHNG